MIAGAWDLTEPTAEGSAVAGKVVVLDRTRSASMREPTARGSSGLIALAGDERAPAAVLANAVDPAAISGFLLAGVTVMSAFEGDVTTAVESGDWVSVNPATKTAIVWRRSAA